MSQRRTVLHLIHTAGAGGAETVMQQLVARLDPAAWRSVACVPGPGWLLSALEEGPAEVIELPSEVPFDVALIQRLLRLIRTRRVELIHTHLFGPAVYASAAARLTGLPVVSTMHGAVDLAAAHRWWGLKTRLLRRRANHFVAVTRALRAQVVRELGIPAEQTRVITNGIDTTAFEPGRESGLREELGWSHDAIVVGAVGNVRRPKAYDTLLRAAAVLSEAEPRCRFVVVGDTEGEPELQRDLLALRRELGLEERFRFAGFRRDIGSVLRNLDIYVMSSVREGLPLAVLQAMAAELPIVATMAGGPQEVLTDGENALLVPVQDPPALAQAIGSLVRDPAAGRRLAAEASRTVHAHYTLDRMTREYEQLYREALGDPRPSRAASPRQP